MFICVYVYMYIIYIYIHIYIICIQLDNHSYSCIMGLPETPVPHPLSMRNGHPIACNFLAISFSSR